MSPRTPITTVEEYRLSEVEKRLKDGAETFAEIRKAIDATNERITEETRVAPWKMWAAFLSLAGVLFSAGGAYMKANDTAHTVEKHEGTIREVEKALTETKGESEALKRSVDGLTKSIDRALTPAPVDPLGRRRPR